MKTTSPLFFLALAILVIAGTFFSIRGFQNDLPEFSSGDVLSFRVMKNRMLKEQVGAPFYQKPGFDSLNYFPPQPGERFRSALYPVEGGEELDLMPDRPGYASHRVVSYVILEKETWRDTLYVLKDLEEASDSVFFIPFTDPTNGDETYGGGRYLDLVVQPGKPAVLDFNFAYNPYCAYNEAFVCALVPRFNRLSRPVRAGEKNYSSLSGH
jgi:uncharacterized protein